MAEQEDNFDPTKIAPTDPPQMDVGIEGPFDDDTGKAKYLSPMDGKLNSDSIKGFDNSTLLEKQPKYNKAESEKVIEGENNARIILGRDRTDYTPSGYGGKGHTRSGAIDLVVGLQGWNPSEKGTFDNRGRYIAGLADKSFGSMNNDKPGDAARIYISQRADIDDYFDICEGGVGYSVADSAIGIKADSVRIMSRKGIKLVTGKGPPGRNSLNGKLNVTWGIDLIAGNRDLVTGKTPDIYGEPQQIQYLQPIPKGYNLEEALKSMHTRIQRLNSVVQGICKGVLYLCAPQVSVRPVQTAISPGTAFPNIDDIIDVLSFTIYIEKAMADLRWQGLKLSELERDYLEITGAKYINSRHNRTN